MGARKVTNRSSLSSRYPSPVSDDATFEVFLDAIRSCRICRDCPQYGKPLDHEPRPVVQVSTAARICIASQAPGTRVHASGRPFTDASGVRLRQWLHIEEKDFYDPTKVAIIPMGFCFPGLTADGSDLPPRRECAEVWRARLFSYLPNLRLLLLIGGYAQRWHLGTVARGGVTETVRLWRTVYQRDPSLRIFPLPHPSWRNTGWLKRHPWFESELLPVLQGDLHDILQSQPDMKHSSQENFPCHP